MKEFNQAQEQELQVIAQRLNGICSRVASHVEDLRVELSEGIISPDQLRAKLTLMTHDLSYAPRELRSLIELVGEPPPIDDKPKQAMSDESVALGGLVLLGLGLLGLTAGGSK